MNPTPERALELAAKIQPSNDGATVQTMAESAEIAAALRAYADLSRKWQAVLDAEVVARIVTAPDGHETLLKGSSVTEACFTHIGHTVTQLIIKPAA